MKKKSVSLVAALILMLAAIPVAASGVAFAYSGHVLYSNWTTSPPTIDGNPLIPLTEWTDAYVNTIVIGPYTLPLLIKNDALNLYAAWTVPDTTGPPVYNDLLAAYFDNGHDQTLTAGDEDSKFMQILASPPIFFDEHWTGVGWAADTSPHGQGAYMFIGGTGYVYEWSVPLNSGDPQDLSASPGDTVGVMAWYYESSTTAAGSWPPGAAGNNPTTWAELVLASEPPPSGGGGGGGGGFCFIATAAYGSYLDSHVETLRDFRDQYLETNPVGSALVSAYYELSPPMAEFIDEHPALKPIVRAGLTPAVALSAVAVNTTLAEKIAMVSGLALVSLALGMWLRRRAARKITY